MSSKVTRLEKNMNMLCRGIVHHQIHKAMDITRTRQVSVVVRMNASAGSYQALKRWSVKPEIRQQVNSDLKHGR